MTFFQYCEIDNSNIQFQSLRIDLNTQLIKISINQSFLAFIKVSFYSCTNYFLLKIKSKMNQNCQIARRLSE
jgi:hypothetical protein